MDNIPDSLKSVLDKRWEQPKILDSPLDAIGRTPMIRLHKIPAAEGIKCEICVKCEFHNTAGSVKDRIALRMIEDAERDGRLKHGGTIIEATAGNTGIGVAYIAAVKGYKCVLTMPDKFSSEKEGLLKALGAQVIRTKTNVKYTDPDSDYGVALRLAEQIPNSIYINQFMNISNPMVHYDITAEEILHQCDGKIDMFVAGCGTGGTLTGVGRKLKEVIPDIQVVGIDPLGSVVAYPDALNDETKGQPYEVEGIGRPFVPLTCDRYMIDKWVKVHDKDAFYMARRLIKEEGILCGGSSGMHFYGALEVAKDLSQNQRCVVLLPDGMRNYV